MGEPAARSVCCTLRSGGEGWGGNCDWEYVLKTNKSEESVSDERLAGRARPGGGCYLFKLQKTTGGDTTTDAFCLPLSSVLLVPQVQTRPDQLMTRYQLERPTCLRGLGWTVALGSSRGPTVWVNT